MLTKTQKGGLAALPLLLLAALGIHLYRQSQPVFVPGAGVPDDAAVGSPEAAMRQARELYDAMKANDWDGLRAPQRLWFLPDQKYAEKEWRRDPRTPAWSFSMPGKEKEGEVVFYTDIYARMNPSYYRGDRMRAEPSGFFIVAFRDGRIEKVPVDTVRQQPVPDKPGYYTACFPGMTGYDKARPDPFYAKR